MKWTGMEWEKSILPFSVKIYNNKNFKKNYKTNPPNSSLF